ncbi:hypothetical protein DFR50_101192 [Roseiarcus fermentans]|uniref:Uncharacterized protein n=1 Tax=Roseiarcus fermentans TaxID=1473586 RepID=A0A366FUE7_9HYPH|nr:hypothetical protein [Roseiarcus fermentans]RBP18248.1 hypothetical protein DFR50_101192 [Roseiarcus fermentans]
MPPEVRYSVERVEDRHWVVIDKARERRRVGRASDEPGARTIVSLIERLRSAPLRVAALDASRTEAA